MTKTDQTRLACLIFAWGAGGIATIIGLGGVLLTGWYIHQDRASESWPQVTGQITTSRIGSSISPSGHTTSNTGLANRKIDTDYSVRLRYIYQVKGQSYASTRLRFGSTRHDERSDAEEEQRKFSQGKKIAVYYHPEKPSRSVLQRGTSGNWGQFIGLLICMLFGLSLLVLSFRATIKKSRKVTNVPPRV